MSATSWTTAWTAAGERMIVERKQLTDYVKYRYISNGPGDGAVVIATDGGLTLFIDIYRPSVDRRLLELPRGQAEALDAGPIATAERELIEETGYGLVDPQHLGQIFSDTGLCGDAANVVRGQVSSNRQPAAEFAELHWLSASQIDAHIASGRIRDGLSLAALALSRVNP